MLTLNLYITEDVDDKTGAIVTKHSGPEIQLEHSLLSVSKWEEKYRKPFMGRDEKSQVEIVDYIDMMITSQDFEGDFITVMTPKHAQLITDYISSSPTATWFNERSGKQQPPSSEIVTSELIYYWMFSLGIDKSCESWNLNRLLTLIKVFDAKSKKPEKMSQQDVMARNKALNAQRKAKLKTKG